MKDSSLAKTSWLLALALMSASFATAQSAPDYGAVLTNTTRPENERALDVARKPNEVMAFYGVKKGEKVADLLSGRGYYTAILSELVGPEGIVYATNERARQEWIDRFKQPPFGNVRTVVGPPDKVALPQDGSLDFALTHLNYHDLSREVRTGMNKIVFAALKKGGTYAIVDHSARQGSGDSDSKTFHRIDKQLVIKEVTEAGFKLVKEGNMLSRPDDKRDFNVNKVRNQDDRFVLMFEKP
jgi:predicted methyltransferase